jgi:hypothetical protein
MALNHQFQAPQGRDVVEQSNVYTIIALLLLILQRARKSLSSPMTSTATPVSATTEQEH